MLRNKAQLECIVKSLEKDAEGNDIEVMRIGHFYCDQDCPLPVAKEILFQFQKYIGHIEDLAEKQRKEQEEKTSAAHPELKQE
jgi:hypothetical protein